MADLRALLDAVRAVRVEAEGCYCRDDLTCQLCGAVLGAEAALADALLADPSALEALETVRALGVARAAACEAYMAWLHSSSDAAKSAHLRRMSSEATMNDAEVNVHTLADRLAKGTDR